MILELDPRNPRHRELKRLMLAAHALGEAYGALKQVEELDNAKEIALVTHVLAAAVVAYARPFVASRSAGRISKNWESFDDSALGALHDRILRLRAKLVAHADDDMVHIRILDRNVQVTITPIEGGTSHTFTNTEFAPIIVTRDSVTQDMQKPFLQLCEFQLGRIKQAVDQLREILRPEMIHYGEDMFGPWAKS